MFWLSIFFTGLSCLGMAIFAYQTEEETEKPKGSESLTLMYATSYWLCFLCAIVFAATAVFAAG